MQSPLLELARQLEHRATTFVAALESSGDDTHGTAVTEALALLQSSIHEIEKSFVEPGQLLSRLAISQQLLVCIHWLCHFRIVSEVPLDNEAAIPYERIAQNVNVSPASLKSVARMAMIFGFFCETPTGQLQHSRLSASFVTDPHMFNWMIYMAKETAPTVASFVGATERWPYSQKKEETAYSLSRGTELSFFEHINLSTQRVAEFGAYMKSQAVNKAGTSVHLLRDGFDWASLSNATVVDVGGGGGDASVSLAEAYPDLKFVVQDLPTTIATARERTSDLPEDIAGRLRFQGHDFFDPQPVVGAAVYLLRMVLHDWTQSDCVRILSQLLPAMRSDSRIVVMDMVLPHPGSLPMEQEAVLRQKDLIMKQNFNAKEREIDEWEVLMAKLQLEIVATKTPAGSQHSVLEVTRARAC